MIGRRRLATCRKGTLPRSREATSDEVVFRRGTFLVNAPPYHVEFSEPIEGIYGLVRFGICIAVEGEHGHASSLELRPSRRDLDCTALAPKLFQLDHTQRHDRFVRHSLHWETKCQPTRQA